MTPRPEPKPSLTTRLASSPRGLAAVVGLSMLAAAGGTYALTSPQGAAALMGSTSAMAAEAIAPSTPSAMPSFANLVEQLKPAVVSVYVDAEISGVANADRGRMSGQGGGDESPFEFFFRQRGQPAPTQKVRAQGSGFFISAEGHILTNNHVVDHAKRVQVKTVDGKTLDAKVIGTDPKTDLAVLKVSGSSEGFKYAKFAATPPKVGDWVLAMGNPYGLGGTVTAGIVSASGRDIGGGPYNDYLQIDAPVNKGNSGGPTFNMQGEVIGVNTAIYSPSGGSVGIAFDIPAGTAQSIAGQLMAKGSVSRGWIGVMVQPVTADIAEGLGLKAARGALVDEVQRGGPAAQAGLRNGDVIVSAGGAEIKDSRDLARKVAEIAPGSKLTLQIMRDGKAETLELSASGYPSDRQQARFQQDEHAPQDGNTKLGLLIAPATAVDGAGAEGVVVMQVDPSGAAAEKGLQQGDVILSAGGKPVTTPDDLSSAVSAAHKDGKNSILMRVRTAAGAHYVALPIGKS